MSEPLVFSIPHSLGKDEAVRRLKSGLGRVRSSFDNVLDFQEEVWTGDHLQFRLSALGQIAPGSIDVAEDRIHLTITLPWLLARFAQKIQALIGNQAKLMLEKR
jgi:hypothetical protein